MKRAALVAGVSATLLYAGAAQVAALPNDADSHWGSGARTVTSDESLVPPKAVKKHPKAKPPEHRSEKRESGTHADKTPSLPPGPLHVIISIEKQRATLFAGGVQIAESKISSGTPGHPTPMGVFTVIQKDRHHVSNLYDAPMPYMQRITWSGSALHEGPLPGRPASHGCVRLTTDFAQLLWKATKIGARVIITRDEVAPVAIESDRLFAFQPKTARNEPTASIKTADAANTLPAVARPDAAKPLVSKPAAAMDEPPAKLAIHHDGTADGLPEPTVTFSSRAKAANALAAPASIIVDEPPAKPPAAIASRKPAPVSVFISLKEHKLYVRQGWEPLFDAPITIEHPEQPIGTHVYTAMGLKSDGSGMRWTVVSIPSNLKNSGKPSTEDQKGRKAHIEHSAKAAPAPSSASAALERIDMPPDMVERIGALVVPGSSLIVSDNKLSGETGDTTDFIVLTQ